MRREGKPLPLDQLERCSKKTQDFDKKHDARTIHLPRELRAQGRGRAVALAPSRYHLVGWAPRTYRRGAQGVDSAETCLITAQAMRGPALPVGCVL